MRLLSTAALAGLVTACLAPSALRAQSFDIHAPDAKAGALEAESLSGINLGAANGHPRNAHEFKLAYGVSDRWVLEVGALVDKRDGEGAHLARISLESISTLSPAKRQGFGLGWFNALEVATSADTHNTLITGPLIHYGAGPATLLINPFVEKSFGSNAEPGFDFSYIWRGKVDVGHHVAAGAMGYGRISNIAGGGVIGHDHRIGPALFFEAELDKGRTVEIGLAAFIGVTRDSPDASIMVNFGVPLVPGRH